MSEERTVRRIGRVLSILATLALAVHGAFWPAAAGTATPVPPQRAALPALRPLDERHAAEFRQAFDEGKDRARYVVALSPT